LRGNRELTNSCIRIETNLGASHSVQELLRFAYLNPIVFDELDNYDMKNLRYTVRKHIKKALRNDVTVSRIVDEREFSENAYPCYMSFYERTKYAFDTSRRKKDRFSRWSHALFEFPETVVLGTFWSALWTHGFLQLRLTFSYPSQQTRLGAGCLILGGWRKDDTASSQNVSTIGTIDAADAAPLLKSAGEAVEFLVPIYRNAKNRALLRRITVLTLTLTVMGIPVKVIGIPS
jgi:hypothetical protein